MSRRNRSGKGANGNGPAPAAPLVIGFRSDTRGAVVLYIQNPRFASDLTIGKLERDGFHLAIPLAGASALLGHLTAAVEGAARELEAAQAQAPKRHLESVPAPVDENPAAAAPVVQGEGTAGDA